MRITIHSKGDYKKTTKFLNFITRGKYIEGVLEKYGEEGLHALIDATPRNSGETAKSWNYHVSYGKDYARIVFTNDNVTKEGTPIAILIQYGHASKSGHWVLGYDFINPAIQPIFDELAEKVWKEVTNE